MLVVFFLSFFRLTFDLLLLFSFVVYCNFFCHLFLLFIFVVYVWCVVQAALEVRDMNIVDDLISNLLQVSYQGLNVKLKKVHSYDSHMINT